MNSNLKAQELQDLSIPNDTAIFHKMCRVYDYWVIDYGTGSDIIIAKMAVKIGNYNMKRKQNFLKPYSF